MRYTNPRLYFLLFTLWMESEFDAACAHLSITVSEIQRDICEKIGILSYPLAFGTPFGMGKLE